MAGRLIIRIKVNSTKARVVLDNKFGCEFAEEAPRLLRLASYLQLAVCGVSFHVGSDSEDPEAFHHSIKHARELFDLGNSLGHTMKVLDIGGGFPGNRGSTIDPFVKVINASLEEYFPEPDVLIIAEPGRYFVSSAMTLATQIQYVREGNELKPTEYFINDGCYGSFNKTKNFSVDPTPMLKVPDKQPMELEKCILWGPTCDGGDCLKAQYLLPRMKVEDWIKFENLGAYTLTTCTEFSLIPVPRAFAVADCSTRNLLQNLQPNMRTHFIHANDQKLDITLWNQHKSSNHEI